MTSTTWNPGLYDASHSFVWKHGASVLDLLAPQAGERILDVGCGTGHLTAKIADSGAVVVGSDSSQAMIDEARRTYPGIRFDVADGRALPYDTEFDAVFSNAALHWISPPDAVVASVRRVLKSRGRFVAEFGGKHNIAAILDAVHTALDEAGKSRDGRFAYYFPSVAECATLLESHGFTVTLAAWFDRPTPLDGEDGMRRWLDMFAGVSFDGLTHEVRQEAMTRAIESARPKLLKDGIWVADYKRIRVVAFRGS